MLRVSTVSPTGLMGRLKGVFRIQAIGKDRLSLKPIRKKEPAETNAVTKAMTNTAIPSATTNAVLPSATTNAVLPLATTNAVLTLATTNAVLPLATTNAAHTVRSRLRGSIDFFAVYAVRTREAVFLSLRVWHLHLPSHRQFGILAK